MKCSTCAETRKVWEGVIAQTPEPRHRMMLQTMLKHWWAEVVYEIEAIVETLTPDCRYRVYGTTAFGGPVEINSVEAARAMYLGQFAAGLMPGGPIDDVRFACGDWGVAFDGLFTLAAPGVALHLPEAGLEPDQLYLVQVNMSVSTPFRGDLMDGEILYMGSPFNVEPTDRDVIAGLLGWDPRSYRG